MRPKARSPKTDKTSLRSEPQPKTVDVEREPPGLGDQPFSSSDSPVLDIALFDPESDDVQVGE